MITSVSVLIGAAHAYACIKTDNGRSADIRLEPGRSASRSLRDYADGERARAAKILARADEAEAAATILEARFAP